MTSMPSTMPGQTALEVIAKVEVRLRMTGSAGKALIGELQSPALDGVDLSNYDRFRVYLSQLARDALNYASGTKRRSSSFREWQWYMRAKRWMKR